MNISFDFDGTLDKPHIQMLAMALIKDGHNVFIITSRSPNTNNEDLYEVGRHCASALICFTDGKLKHTFCKGHKIDLHFDNDPAEVKAIHDNGGKALLLWDSEFIEYFINAKQSE